MAEKPGTGPLAGLGRLVSALAGADGEKDVQAPDASPEPADAEAPRTSTLDLASLVRDLVRDGDPLTTLRAFLGDV